MDERARVARAAAGDAAAFAFLVRVHQGKLRAFLLRLTKGDHALADDLAQETFITAHAKLAQFRGEGAFAGWLYRIAYSRFLMDVRARKNETELDETAAAAPGEGEVVAKLDLERAMARLAPAETASLTLCYALGFSNEEAARILSLPLGTLKSHVLRGREKLKRALGAEQEVVS